MNRRQRARELLGIPDEDESVESEKVYKANGRKENLQFQQSGQNSRRYDGSFGLNQGKEKFDTSRQMIGEGNVDGLKWTWVAQIDNATMTTTSEKVISSYLKFKWENLEGVLGFTGKITFKLRSNAATNVNKSVDALIEFSGQWIGVRNLTKFDDVFPQEYINQGNQYHQNNRSCTIEFEFSLTPVFDFPTSINIISNFEKSHITDGILEVEGNQLHVNKSFLSIHSEFFFKLFNSNFKEKSQSIVPIKDVEYTDFSNFLSLIYPNQAEITVDKVGKYLELADKYLMTEVTRKCEEFLLQNRRVKKVQKIVFADQHYLNKLLRETLSSIVTKEELEGLTMLPEFSTLSDSTKASILHKFMHFLN